MSRHSERAATLVLALFVVAVIFVAGLGFAERSQAQYRASVQTGRAASAMALAEAGIQDALTKLRRDWAFPPASAEDQTAFSYQDSLTNSRGETVGSYQVEMDLSKMKREHKLLLIRSRGRLGPPSEPLSERSIEVEIDMEPTRPTYFQVLNWTDLGGF
jgi:hypothetical protein